jgi:phosphatidylglycerophosphatase A
LGWFFLTLWAGSFWIYLALMVAASALAVVITGQAERALGRSDPPSVVLDEIIALPWCFFGCLAAEQVARGAIAGPAAWCDGGRLLVLGLAWLAFRVFDITKPWPLRHLQRAPGGWGITLDDLGAAALTNLLLGGLSWLRLLPSVNG